MLNVPAVKFTTPAEIGWKSLQGIEYVPIKDTGKGLQVRRKRLEDAQVLPYVHRLFSKAWSDLQELQQVQGLPVLPPAKDFDTLVSAFKSGHSDVVQVPCDEEDRMARIISLVQEGFAILAYIIGEDTLQTEITGRQEKLLA
jgi:hypothetical protein